MGTAKLREVAGTQLVVFVARVVIVVLALSVSVRLGLSDMGRLNRVKTGVNVALFVAALQAVGGLVAALRARRR